MRTRANPSKTYSVSMHCSARGSHSLIGCRLFLLPLIIRPGGGAESGVDTTRPGQAGAHGRGSSSRRRTFGRMPCGAADIRAVSFELALDLLGVKVDNADRAVIGGRTEFTVCGREPGCIEGNGPGGKDQEEKGSEISKGARVWLCLWPYDMSRTASL